MEVRNFEIEDYEQVQSIWKSSEGVGLDADVDSRDRIAMYLQRNPGLSFVATEKKQVVGAVLCGHDGRRGYLHHLAVAQKLRGQGVGALLVDKTLGKLRAIGIRRCHIFVYAENDGGIDFWKRIGWDERSDLKINSKEITF